MKTWNGLKVSGAAAIISLLALNANATIVYNNPTGLTGLQGGGPWNLGLDFTVNTAGYVNAMGAYDDGLNGFSGTVPVALYRVSDGTQVSGTYVELTGSPATVDGSSRFVSISPVYLEPGVYSVVGANFGTANPFKNALNGPASATFDTVSGALTMGTWRDASGATLAFPTTDVGGVNYPPGTDPRWTAATFDFTPVPEVATFGAAAVGLLGLVYGARHVRNRRKKQGA